MNIRRRSPSPTRKAPNPGDPSFHRSGAVANMLRMPVATLRVWERRYGLTQPELSPSGQRLYSAADVRRLALIKQLTDLGHAIGSLAPLDMRQLQRVASTHTGARATTRAAQHLNADPVSPVRPWRLAVIGAALVPRLQRPALLRRLGRPVAMLGPFDDAAQAAATLRSSDLDAWLFYEPHVHEGWLASVEAAAPAFAKVPKAVLYGFAADPVCEALATAGTALLRAPQPDAVVGQWLCNLSSAATAEQPAAGALATPKEVVPAPRWDDAALAEFAGRSSTVDCECPHHVAELLVQLSHFEAYSAECQSESAVDAELHADLGQTAAASRVRFEVALERVALHEGLMLPAPPGHVGAYGAPSAPPALASARLRRRT